LVIFPIIDDREVAAAAAAQDVVVHPLSVFWVSGAREKRIGLGWRRLQPSPTP
jgi:hypothetical protein